jgi:NADPH:quinone reductase-like Zn-dependent oxidoreductase
MPGVNPIDYKRLGQLTTASTFPVVVGIDFAGVLERVPTGERDLNAGDRTFGMARTHGAAWRLGTGLTTSAAPPSARPSDIG